MFLRIRRVMCGGCLKSFCGRQGCNCKHPEPVVLEVKTFQPLRVEYSVAEKSAIIRAVR